MNITTNLSCRLSSVFGFISKSKTVCQRNYIIPVSNFKIERALSKKQFEFFICRRNWTSGNVVVAKKRLPKKKRPSEIKPDGFRVSAFCTAKEYDLESLSQFLPVHTQFKPTTLGSEFAGLTDFVHAENTSVSSLESQHLFFFREGSVVMWNVPDVERMKVLGFLKQHEDSSFDQNIIDDESEQMTYDYSSEFKKTKIVQDNIMFVPDGNYRLEKYAISNAMALSVHLGAYEANLERYIETMEPVTEDLKKGNKIKMSREEVLRKTGQLFALRHIINLSSDLLDTPDFYWDREELEVLYQTTFNYFCISKRTRVMNEKINHCVELVELLSSHLNDKHHVRLEWMIIILIMVEVAFEIVHYVDRYLDSQEKEFLSSSSSV